MTFSRHDDGSVTVDEFPEEFVLTTSSLHLSDKVVIEQDRVRIYVSNGEATYLISQRYDGLDKMELTRLYSKMWNR